MYFEEWLDEDMRAGIKAVNWFKKDDGSLDDRRQMMKIQEEYGETLEAYGVWKENSNDRNKLKLACEIIDTMTACATFLEGFMPAEDIEKAILMVNIKNELSGYGDTEE